MPRRYGSREQITVRGFERLFARRKFPTANRSVRPIECADGFTMSVQAGDRSYSSPQDNYGPYDSYEVVCPSDEEELLLPYAERTEYGLANPTDNTYPWVPAQVVVDVINKHGGIGKKHVEDDGD